MTTPPHPDRTSGEPPQDQEPVEAATAWASPDTGAAPAPPVPAPPVGIPPSPPPPGFAPPAARPVPPAPTGPLRTSRLAITTLVTGLLGLAPVAIAFGIAALVVLRRRTRKGKGLAYGGLAASLAWIVAAVAVAATMVVSTFSVDRTTSDRVTESDKVHISTLHEGDCYTGFELGDIPSPLLDVVPCTDPHRGEVIARVPTGARRLPAAEVCAYRGAYLATSRYIDELKPFIHSPETLGDDQAVICAMNYIGDEPLTTRLAETLDDSLKKYEHLRVGECVKEPRGEQLAEYMRSIPCTRPHQYQVYAIFDVPYQYGDPAVLPKQEYIDRATEKGCDDRLRDAIDEEPGADYELLVFTPTPQTWNGSREAVCFVGLPDGAPLTKSIVEK
ncbi:septum formation family protein [Actinomadura sp. LOL_016]|uniref:DUF4190 domain-containing protein n=1 Tax=unclassified Actinomadura TaxID=2626254 RepID=UPI003A80EC15